ncbi:CU044_5270 family protein, partial [Nonomuraea sp. MCN248]
QANPLTAAEVLEDAALVAERTDVPDPRPDQWFYLKERQPIASAPVLETWSRMDGARTAVRQGDGGTVKAGAEKGPTNPLKTQQEVLAFPGEPDALLAHLRGMDERAALSICQPECPAGTEDDVKAFGALQWYLKFGPVIPPDKAAAMYRAMARIPNVKIEENVSTADGRTGLGVVLDLGEAGKGYTILDPADYRYLGVKSVRGGHELAMSVLAAGVVDRPGQTP